MASLASLILDRKEVQGHIDTLNKYRPKFSGLKGDFSGEVESIDKSTISAVSYWKGPTFDKFNTMATRLTEGDSRYTKSFDALDRSIESRISKLEGQRKQLDADIKAEKAKESRLP